jgi:hypothetical protein
MRFRFVLSHAESGTNLEISEPSGWLDATIKLDRHEEFHSLIEYFDGSFIFYGNNGLVNGGIEYIKDIIRNYGIDTTLLIDIDFTYDDETYSEIFQGQLSLVDSEELPKNKMRVPIIRDDRWAKFISRLETPVNIQSETDLDDNVLTGDNKVNLRLTSQVIKMNTLGKMKSAYPYGILGDLDSGTLDPAEFAFLQIDWDEYTLEEIKTMTNYPIAYNPVLPFEKFYMDYAGSYHFKIKFYMTHAAVGYISPGVIIWDAYYDMTRLGDPDIEVVLMVNGVTIGTFTQTDYGTDADDSDPAYSSFEYEGTHDLPAGALVVITGVIVTTFPFVPVLLGYDNTGIGAMIEATIPGLQNLPVHDFPNGLTDDNEFTVTALTTFPETIAESFLIHDAAGYIIDRICGEEGIFYSELLGSQHTQYRQYLAKGCAWQYALVKGLQLRGYTLTEKKFFQSFMDWWRGANPILNLSLCYETLQIPHIVDVSPDINLLDDLADWDNAPGAGWDFITFGEPFVSVNGDGGLEGYTIGAGVFNEDQPYEFDVNLFIYTTGVNTPNAVVTYAILDAGFGELATREFNYVGPGNNPETFILIPTGVGAYFGVKIENNTPSETKNFQLTLAFTEDALVEYTTESVIRIEDKAYQYDDEETSIDFSYIQDITKKYDNDRIFNKVSIGYTKWESEDISGIDDPQSKKTYNSRFKKVGKEISLYSEFIAASLIVEQARRTSKIKSADYKYDNETFIIALNETPQDESPDISPDIITFIPELDENFTFTENLESPETRYNLRLTPARNFLRWQDFLDGALQDYLGSDWRFSSAQGNYHFSAIMEENGCDEDYDGFELAEDANILVDDNFLHLPDLYEATIPMDWQDYATIRDNPRKPIGISKSDTGHARMFIKTLSFQPMHGEAKILMWAKDFLDLSVEEDRTPMQECLSAGGGGEFPDCENGITDEDGFYLTDEFGECITTDVTTETGGVLDMILDGVL